MWVLIRKDLMRRWRNPLATIVMIVFPLFMSLAIGSLGGSGGSDFPRIKVLLQNKDTDGFLSNAIMGAAGQGEGQEYLELVQVGDEGVEMMEDGKASAMVILPEDFTKKVFARDPVEISVIRNPAEGIKPEIVVQGTEVVATYLDQGARLLGEELGIIKVMLESENIPASTKVGAVAAGITTKIEGVEDYLFPPLVEIGSVKESEEEEEKTGGGNIYGYVLIMTAVMALLFVATRSMNDIFEEANNGMLRRQLSTPMGIGTIVGAKTGDRPAAAVDHPADRPGGRVAAGCFLQPGGLRIHGPDPEPGEERKAGRHSGLADHHGHERHRGQHVPRGQHARFDAGRGRVHHQPAGH
jgi:hypothetical protein